MKNPDDPRLYRKILLAAAAWAALFAFGFVFNFVWEALHGVYLYQGHDMRASRYVPMLVYVSGIDAALILLVYGIEAVWLRDPLWLRVSDRYRMFLFVLSAVFLSGFIEYRAVYRLHRWAYLPAMPTVFGIGVSPLLQLAATGTIAIGLVKRLFFPACEEPD